ncbi:MAG: (Fe-S)-binding protein [SAR324 cluster bacterium]|nr:(Fe-S)-binding protein [SAR324 cluster bacterium]
MHSSNPRSYPSKPEQVYFFGTCLVDTIYPEAGLAAVELMEREGVQVIYPMAQTCCGQPPFNSGYWEEGRVVAAAQMALFPKPIPVVVPSGSCAAMMHGHYPHLFQDGRDDEQAAQAREFAARVFEWSDFMLNVLAVRLQDQGPPVKVTYHPSCHLLREMGVREAPVRLLEQLGQVTYVPLPEAEECCGFGGTFSVKHSDISWAMVEDKRRTVAESGAEVLVSMDCGCLMQIGGAMAKAGQNTRVIPLPQFLRQRTMEGANP